MKEDVGISRRNYAGKLLKRELSLEGGGPRMPISATSSRAWASTGFSQQAHRGKPAGLTGACSGLSTVRDNADGAGRRFVLIRVNVGGFHRRRPNHQRRQSHADQRINELIRRGIGKSIPSL